jgi:hypothetical protein
MYAYPQKDFPFKIHHKIFRRLKTNQNQNQGYPTVFAKSTKSHNKMAGILKSKFFRKKCMVST